MSRISSLFLLLFLLFSGLSAQTILQLKTGKIQLPQQSATELKEALTSDQGLTAGFRFRLVSFYQLPKLSEKRALEAAGLYFVEFIPPQSMLVAIPQDWQQGSPLFSGVYEIPQSLKLSPSLENGFVPDHARVGKKQADILLTGWKNIPQETFLAKAKAAKLEILSDWEFARQITVRVPADEVEALSQLAFVQYVEPIDPPIETHNYTSRTIQQTNMLNVDYPGGLNFTGAGVVVGMGDDGLIGPHIDYQGRIRGTFTTANDVDQHGDHVGGTIFGAGNLEPKSRGMATSAELIVYYFSAIISGSPNHYLVDNMVITNNSYGSSSGGNCSGVYTGAASAVDEMIRLYPNMMHFFSAGNEGVADCGWGAGPGWGNLGDGRNIGKNIVTVGALTTNNDIASFSSRGPAEDGRIKPDICSKGVNTRSTIDPNTYASYDGTSMSCPSVTGGCAQLIEAWRMMKGTELRGALLKAIIMNTTRDLGNPGPDFKTGYGEFQVWRAYQMMLENRYDSASVAQGDSASFSITVPAGVQEFRVLIGWADYEGSTSAATSLVNDLDLEVYDPSNGLHLPWVLNPAPSPATLDLPAVPARDSLNNTEQVTFTAPAPGVYKVKIKGYSVPQGPQQVYMTWEFRDSSVMLTYPVGGESFVPNEYEKIRWDAVGDWADFDLDYSLDNGNSWTAIATVTGNKRYYDWQIPDSVVSKARVRVTRGNSADMGDTTFTLIKLPSNLTVDAACPYTANVSWGNVPDAIGYRVYVLGNKYMEEILVSGTNSATITGLDNLNQGFWWSVAAIAPDSGMGRRAIAKFQSAGVFSCPDSNDVSVRLLTAPGAGIIYDCNAVTNQNISIELENFSPHDITNIPVAFQVNGGTVVTDLFTGTLPAYGTALFTFTGAPQDFDVIGTDYDVFAWTDFSGDPFLLNDSLHSIISVLDGDVVSVPFSEDFETFTFCSTQDNCEGEQCALSNGWNQGENSLNDDIDWRVSQGETPTDFTGPDMDHNPGNIFGRYLYTEASDCYDKVAELYSPCMDLSGVASPQFTFWFHKYGQEMGNLHVDVFSDGVWTMDAINPVIGDWTNNWWEEIVDLSAYAGKTVHLRIRGVTGNGARSDMVIDDISVGAPVSTDPGIAGQNVQLYPNPAAGSFYLNWQEMTGEIEIQVTDMMGRLVFEKAAWSNNGIYAVELPDMAAQTLVVTARSGDVQVSKLLRVE